MHRRKLALTAFVALLSPLAACGGEEGEETTDAADTSTDVETGDAEPDTDASDVADTTDVGVDATDTTPDAVDAADGSGDVAPDAEDVTPDVPPPDFSVELNWPIFAAPADPLAESDVESCAVYRETRCVDGHIETCQVYDTDTEEWITEPDDLTRRAFLYDRWYDLYSSPSGQTAERIFTEEMPAGTPEEIWSDPANFAGWGGGGDSAIWTGTALNAYILRYLSTGTEADYARMEEKTRVMLNFFEVTRIPGYLARFHYLVVPPGTPQDPDYYFRYDTSDNLDERDIEDPATLDFLPEIYTSGLGTPRWSGDPSIDQYNGP
ncbi:MAG: hypothetical protein H6700_08285, partial [Myxococcales bacterium]|nr:hypothetical protein [Myxococcales bacterium]